MKIGKLEVKKWSWYWGGLRMKNPIHILLSALVWPIYLFGAVLMAFACGVSDWSIDSAVEKWKDS